ncbi:aldo-keto reductase-1 [Coleophoma cylindrospora]|uniref:Aldo-keto reductase-1 n=1 Tax=Coleophoma cylindrospora TaxID=1849047 RepID=A0A3D8QNP5_9HELO|nr:aldo-keto reductase-1 [Coleophoma cylindrospora]
MATAVPLSTKYTLPILGYGVLQVAPEKAPEFVAKALEVGYRHIDSATMYQNEAACGEAIRASGLPRESVFYTSKSPPDQHGYDATVKGFEASLQKSGLDYIDLYLLHTPFGGKEGRIGGWKALLEAQRAGKVRSIGVSNWGVHHLQELEDWIQETDAKEGKGTGGKISVGQWEIHPWLARKDITDWCAKHGVVVEAYSPLVRGLKMHDPLLKALAEKYGKSPAQILLRWSVQQGFVPLPKSEKENRMRENADIFDFELSADDMKTLETGKYETTIWDPTTDTS